MTTRMMTDVQFGIWASGDWLTPERRRIYPRLFVAFYFLAALLAIVLGSNGFGANGKPIGTDFVSFYAAGSLAVNGQAARAYDHESLGAVERALFGPQTPLYTWLYPPIAFLAVTPFAFLPYFAALALWLSATFLFLARAAKKIFGNGPIIMALAAMPAVFLNFGHGQNGFLSAGLLAWALLLLESAPIRSGLLIAALSFKPHLGLLLPFAFLAGGYFRAFLSAALGSVFLAGLSWILFGGETWLAFLAKSDFSRSVLEQGLVDWSSMVSIFASIRLLGGDVAAAWSAQIFVSLCALIFTVYLWRGRHDFALKAAGLSAAVPLTTPFALDYDLTLLALPLLWLMRIGRMGGFLAWEITLMAAVWLLPLFSRALALGLGVPLAPLAALIMVMLCLRRARAAQSF